MTATEPSAGATGIDREHQAYIDRLRQQLSEVNARRVKAESGLTEALDALRGMVGLVQLIQSTESPAQKHLVMSNHRFIEAQRVIAKAENPNSETVQSYPSGRWTEKGTV